MKWSDVLTREKLLQFAGSRSYSAGMNYAESGAVSGLSVSQDTMTALVQGTELYEVELTFNPAGDLIVECSCPYGEEGNFCKHCVAVGIVGLESANASSKKAYSTREGFRDFLEKQDKAYLVTLLLEQVRKDTDLQNLLSLKIAKSQSKTPDLNAYRHTITRTLTIAGFLEYGEARHYASSVENVLASLRELLEIGFAAEARQLTEYALDVLAKQMKSMDDSGGHVGAVWSNLHALHLETTLQSPPPAQELVQWLLRTELEMDWDVEVGWQDYLPALGEEGKELFIAEITKRWNKLPELVPGDKKIYSSERYRLTQLMTEFARSQGDIHGVITIKKRNLSLPYHFLEIAELYLQAGEPENAMEWAETGQAAFRAHPDERLLDFLVEQYTQHQRYAEAYAILWQRFRDRPALDAYQGLHLYAEARGEWEAWRAKGWEHLRTVRTQPKSEPKARGYGLYSLPSDYSEEVRILLYEGRDDEAWDEAQAGGCSRSLWLELAIQREISHPEDALRLYREEVARKLDEVTGDYSEPFRYILKVREILLRTGQEAKFTEYARFLRAEYKRKRNFIKLLDTNRFPT